MNRYFRVSPRFANSDENSFSAPSSLESKLRPGDRLVLAEWDEGAKKGVCRAIGIVTAPGDGDGVTWVVWHQCRTEFYPNPPGYQQWRKPQGWFQFARQVVERYRLEALFSRHLPVLEESDA